MSETRTGFGRKSGLPCVRLGLRGQSIWLQLIDELKRVKRKNCLRCTVTRVLGVGLKTSAL